MRTLDTLAAHYKKIDPDTAITKHFLRAAVLAGHIRSTKAGNKRLVAIEDADDYLFGVSTSIVLEQQHGQIQHVEL